MSFSIEDLDPINKRETILQYKEIYQFSAEILYIRQNQTSLIYHIQKQPQCLSSNFIPQKIFQNEHSEIQNGEHLSNDPQSIDFDSFYTKNITPQKKKLKQFK